jgi:TatD DNase family protein
MSARRLPPLDMHAHIDPTMSRLQLEQLGAVVFAATRTPAEFAEVWNRADLVTVWGLGCHPGLTEAVGQFDDAKFRELMQQAPFIGEVGLDGRSPVPLDQQLAVFRSVLRFIQESPRIVSIHSARATGRVIDCLEEIPVHGAVLHWWLGTPAETKRAVDAGCFFSVNLAMAPAKLEHVPLDRVLTETDHPYGNRSGVGRRQPGTVADVESKLAEHYGVTADAVRSTVWVNLSRLVEQTGVGTMLSGPVQKMLVAAQRDL